jgi:hypothetical protein
MDSARGLNGLTPSRAGSAPRTGLGPCPICAGDWACPPLPHLHGTKRAHPSSVSTGTKWAHPHGGRTGSLLVASAPGPNGLTPSTSAPGLPGSPPRSWIIVKAISKCSVPPCKVPPWGYPPKVGPSRSPPPHLRCRRRSKVGWSGGTHPSGQGSKVGWQGRTLGWYLGRQSQWVHTTDLDVLCWGSVAHLTVRSVS